MASFLHKGHFCHSRFRRRAAVSDATVRTPTEQSNKQPLPKSEHSSGFLLDPPRLTNGITSAVAPHTRYYVHTTTYTHICIWYMIVSNGVPETGHSRKCRSTMQGYAMGCSCALSASELRLPERNIRQPSKYRNGNAHVCTTRPNRLIAPAGIRSPGEVFSYEGESKTTPATQKRATQYAE